MIAIEIYTRSLLKESNNQMELSEAVAIVGRAAMATAAARSSERVLILFFEGLGPPVLGQHAGSHKRDFS